MIVTLNGTETNPYHKMGLKINPFPILGRAQYNDTPIRLLGANPISEEAKRLGISPTDYIKGVLQGFSQEFVDLCCDRYRPGKLVKFEVSFSGEED